MIDQLSFALVNPVKHPNNSLPGEKFFSFRMLSGGSAKILMPGKSARFFTASGKLLYAASTKALNSSSVI